MRVMLGVILEATVQPTGEVVRIMLELDAGIVLARRGYGERNATLVVELDALEAALGALKAEAARRPPEPMPGQTELAVDVELDAGEIERAVDEREADR